jgi:hypothetical protein
MRRCFTGQETQKKSAAYGLRFLDFYVTDVNQFVGMHQQSTK